MRTALLALALIATTSAVEAASPDAESMKSAWSKADSTCRGGTDPDSFATQQECARRDRLSGRLSQVGWCYGKKSQDGYQYRWHRCTADSMDSDDLRPATPN